MDFKALSIRNLQKMDIFHSKLMTSLLSVPLSGLDKHTSLGKNTSLYNTNTLAWTNTIAYCRICTLRIRNVFIVQTLESKIIYSMDPINPITKVHTLFSGGLLGLVLGMGFVSFVEIFWQFLRVISRWTNKTNIIA